MLSKYGKASITGLFARGRALIKCSGVNGSTKIDMFKA
jgi:hypothetical protein